jgi:hypothetical protein
MGAALVTAYVLTIPDRLERDRAEEAAEKRRNARSREQYGQHQCPDAFVDICWEFDPADAHSALSAPPPWETYQRIVEHLRERPLPLDDERSRKVWVKYNLYVIQISFWFTYNERRLLC